MLKNNPLYHDCYNKLSLDMIYYYYYYYFLDWLLIYCLVLVKKDPEFATTNETLEFCKYRDVEHKTVTYYTRA